ncbi:hypothetical protein JW916_02960 [Candidatus Sumerlaeota bacterium]|nr:hypothetical protein [Candidatus Sumerlaeota bacterium]
MNTLTFFCWLGAIAILLSNVSRLIRMAGWEEDVAFLAWFISVVVWFGLSMLGGYLLWLDLQVDVRHVPLVRGLMALFLGSAGVAVGRLVLLFVRGGSFANSRTSPPAEEHEIVKGSGHVETLQIWASALAIVSSVLGIISFYIAHK